jgi:hypothetical protein
MSTLDRCFLDVFARCLEDFPHAAPYAWSTGNGFVGARHASQVAAELTALSWWHRVHRDFYTQEEIPLSRLPIDAVPPTISEIIDAAANPSVATAASRLSASGSRLRLVSVTAHRLRDGDHIDVHNDANPYGEELRLTWMLGLPPDRGGGFAVHECDDGDRVARLVHFRADDWVCFLISGNSFHSVPTVDGTSPHGRLSIIFTWGSREV